MSFTVEQLDDAVKITCDDCGIGVTISEDRPVRHACSVKDDEQVTYWPENFDAAAFTQARQPTGPSLLRKAANLGRAVAAHAAAGWHKAPDEVVAERFAICKTNRCGLFQANDDGSGKCLHSTCGCNLFDPLSESLLVPNKLRWSEQQCPKGLWLAVPSPQQPDDADNPKPERHA